MLDNTGDHHTDLEQSRDTLLRAAAPHDLGAFGWYVHGWKPARHHKLWIKVLEDPSIKRYCFICPPGHAKTNWTGIAYPSWRIGQNPNIRMGYISASSEQACKPSVTVRETLQHSKRYRDVFPHIRPNPGRSWSESNWYVERSDMSIKDATMFASGYGGPVIGSRWDDLLIDDICTQENMSTDAQRQKVRDWVFTTAFSRVVPGGRIGIIMTRWHEEDLIKLVEQINLAGGDEDPNHFKIIHTEALGFWEKQAEIDEAAELTAKHSAQEHSARKGVRFRDSFAKNLDNTESTELTAHKRTAHTHNGAQRIKGVRLYSSSKEKTGIEAEREQNRKLLQTPLGTEHKDLPKESKPRISVKQAEKMRNAQLLEGAALWPEQWPKESLMFTRAVDPVLFTKMYQGYPSAPEGDIFKRSWWRYYRALPEAHEVRAIIQSWDTAFKKGEDNSFSVGLSAVITNSGMVFITDRIRERMEFPSLLKAVKMLYAYRRPHLVLIEDKASGQSLVQALVVDSMIPILPHKVQGDKIAKANSITGLIHAGRVALPFDAEWLDSFIDEFADFPNAARDDQVDALFVLLNYLIQEDIISMEQTIENFGQLASREDMESEYDDNCELKISNMFGTPTDIDDTSEAWILF